MGVVVVVDDEVGPPAKIAVSAWLNKIEKQGFYDAETTTSTMQDPDDEIDGPEPVLLRRFLEEEKDSFLAADPFDQVPEEFDVEAVEGEASGAGALLTGHCTVRLKSGYALSGWFRKGLRWGAGMLLGPALESRGILGIWGRYRAGKIQGPGKVQLLGRWPSVGDCNDGEAEEDSIVVLEGHFREGCLEGLVRGLSMKDGRLAFAGRFRRGAPEGSCWIAVRPGDAWLYGTLDSRGRFSGHGNAFVYPDLSTALLGVFAGGRMESAREAIVSGASSASSRSVLRLEFRTDPSSNEFKHWPSTARDMPCPKLQQDPLEAKTVIVAPSTSHGAGEGLFLKVPAEAGATVSFYNGIRVAPGQESQSQSSVSYQIYLDWTHKKVNNSVFLDIPSEYASLDAYRATLGHKINHSFRPNCKWDKIDHPVFGLVPRIVTLVDLPAGTELTCHYMIDMGEAFVRQDLKWYVDLWEKERATFSEESGSSQEAPETERHPHS